MRVFDRDLIRGGHYGQRSSEPHRKAEHMAAPTNAVKREKSSCQHGAVHTWHIASFRCDAMRNLVAIRGIADIDQEAGAAPWVKPWSATPSAKTPYNALSNRPYSGCNVVLLWMSQAGGYRPPRFL
jgi:hypothetical protein